MSMNLPADSLFGMPSSYAFLLVGMVLGLLIGFFAGRWSGSGRSPGAAAQPEQEVAEPVGPAAVPAGISLVVNGRTIDVPGPAMAEIQTLIRAKKKAEAIKALRETSGLGPAEAKAVMESLEQVIR